MKKSISLLLIGLFLLAACKPLTSTPMAVPTSTQPALTNTPVLVDPTGIPTTNPTATQTAAPTMAPAPTGPDVSSTVYLDDRSTPASLAYSLANAFNRHEFVRAYSYWSDPQPFLGTLDAFSNNYAPLTSMQVLVGNTYADGAAGSIYYTLPAILKIAYDNNSNARMAACFILRFPQPGNYGAPPIDPLHIEQSQLVVSDAGLSDAEVMTKACDGMGSGNSAPGVNAITPALENVADLSRNNYIDNRSGAVEVISSLFNALNRKEYVRAYSYWQDPAMTLGDFDTYAAGFTDTDSITAIFGEVAADAGAGQWYYQVPVAQVVQTTSGTTQTFVGCYTLHLSNPAFQGALPFESMAIKNGHFNVVVNGVDTAPLLASVCN